MIRPLAIILAGTAAAGTAVAGDVATAPADAVIVAPAPIPMGSFWEGPYVGGQLGYTFGEFDLNGSFDDDSVIGGLTAGYLFSLGNGWYMGPELQYDWADVTVTDPGTGNTATFKEMARLKLLAGTEVGNGLLYGSVGYAYADFNGIGTFFNGSADSYVVGLGYDWRVGDNWTLGGEYMFHSFDGVGNGGGDVDFNTIHVKATYRF